MIRQLVLLTLVALASCATAQPVHRIAADHLYWCAQYLSRGLLEQAEARCELSIELKKTPHAHNLLGLIERARGDLDGAARQFKRALALEEMPEVLNNYGEVFVDRSEWTDARDLFLQALEIDPTYVTARANYAKSLYHAGETDRAAREYLKCTEQDANQCECRLGLGVIASDGGDTGAAIEHFEKMTRICPNAPMGFYNLCWAYLGVRRCSEAVAACERALAIHPDYLEARAARTRAAECVAQQDAALGQYMARVDAHPDDAELRFNLGCLYEDHHRYEEARQSFDACLRLEPGHARARFRAARVADRQLRAPETVANCLSFLEQARAAELETEREWCTQRVRELR